MPRISVIAAIGKQTRAICENQNLLWEIPDDLKRLRNLTMGHSLIMGRKTYESIGHPLKGRTNIIVTRDLGYTEKIPEQFRQDVIVVNSTEEAIEKGVEIERKRENGEVFIFGGAEIYNQTIHLADKLYLTIVESDEDEKRGTAYFPQYESLFYETERKECFWKERAKKYWWVDFEKKEKGESFQTLLSRASSEV